MLAKVIGVGVCSCEFAGWRTSLPLPRKGELAANIGYGIGTWGIHGILIAMVEETSSIGGRMHLT